MEALVRYGDLLTWAPALALLLVTVLISFSRVFERNGASLALLLAVVFWIWAGATVGFVADRDLKSLMFYWQYGCLAVVPVAWVGTCLRMVGSRSSGGAVVLGGLGLVTLGTWALLLTDGQLHWFFRVLDLPPAAWTFHRENGVGYYAFLVILFSSVVLGAVILARARPFFSTRDRKRSSLILWTALLPVVAGLVDVGKVLPEPRIALVPWAILATSTVFLWAIGRGRLFTPFPLAYETVVNTMADPVVVMDSTQRPVWFNEAARQLWANHPSHQRLEDLFPGLVEHLPTLRTGGEVVFQHSDRQFRVQGAPAQDSRSGLESLAFVFHDVTQMKAEQARLEALVDERTQLLHQSNLKVEEELQKSKEAQLRLEALVSEKNLLVQEVNHRVKNNLQIILSLINLQARRLVPGSADMDVLAGTQGRIRSIGLVHDLIYRSGSDKGLDLGTYLEALVWGISGLYTQQEISVEILPLPQAFPVGVDFSVDFGLVANELVTNALKHGLVPAGGGRVTVGVDFTPEALVLTVKDTGPGFSEGRTLGTSLGLSLVQSICKKHRAEVSFLPGPGTVAEVRFPWHEPDLPPPSLLKA